MSLKRPLVSLVSTMRLVFSAHLNRSQILQEKVYAFFYLGIRDGLFNRGVKGAKPELTCQGANLARGASTKIVREQGLFPRTVRSPGLKAKGKEWAFFQKEACILQDGIGNLVFNEIV